MTDIPIPEGDSLFSAVVRRIRAAQTALGDNVKLSLRQLEEDQLSRLSMPFGLVVPTVDRPPNRPASNDYDFVVAPRSIAVICQFDGFNSDQEHKAAAQIEVVRYQLLDCLVNWRPFSHYDATGYGGMRIEAVKAPAVRVSFVFSFYETLNFTCDENSDGCEPDSKTAVRFIVKPVPDCGDPPC